jgi:hypothetical protein
MKLNNSERASLRLAMLDSFTVDSLDIFVQDHLDVVLAEKVSTAGAFEVVCQNFIRWAEDRGRLTSFLQSAVNEPTLPHMLQIATQLIAKAQAAAAPAVGNGKPFVVSGRPVLDRDPLWQRVTTLGGPGANRVLVVNGGVGKSHSVWVLSYLCDPALGAARLVWLDARDARVPITPGSLARLLASRLWDTATGAGPDPFAQDARDSKGLATLLINRLSALPTPTWLVIDELDLVNLEPESLDLLTRLSQAIDAGQCPNVWLFLIGLDPSRLGAQIAQFVPVDQVTRPKRDDIENYVTWFARSVNSSEPSAKIDAAVGQLDAVLQHTPSYADWEAFHMQLRDTCGRLAKGMPL